MILKSSYKCPRLRVLLWRSPTVSGRRMAPVNLTFELVQCPNESTVEEAVAIFAQVMISDPAAIALAGGNLVLIPDLGRCMLRALLLCPGTSHMFTARDETGALIGYTVLALPGQLMLSTGEQREAGKLLEFMAKLSPEGQAYYTEAMGKEVPQANDEAFGVKESERNTYWCNFAMVRSDYQGKGVAKALFELVFKEAEKLYPVVALTTTNIRNVPIYEKIGFTLFGEKVMQSPWIEWHLWFFSKDRRTV
ncbi:hypothetical protein C8Q76DRAFT_739026 [Earliella scabrosa]|nr:hypothetical protein C8Q76DRAFT_739026 [Earliella scabrosa]